MDIKMPELDEIDARILTEEAIAPVLLVTAYSDHELIEQAKQAGVVGYIVKPFQETDLAPAIEVSMATASFSPCAWSWTMCGKP